MEKTLLIVDNSRMSIYSSILTKILKYYKFIEPKKKKKKWKSEVDIHDTLGLRCVKRVNKGLPLRNLELSFAAGVGGGD